MLGGVAALEGPSKLGVPQDVGRPPPGAPPAPPPPPGPPPPAPPPPGAAPPPPPPPPRPRKQQRTPPPRSRSRRARPAWTSRSQPDPQQARQPLARRPPDRPGQGGRGPARPAPPAPLPTCPVQPPDDRPARPSLPRAAGDVTPCPLGVRTEVLAHPRSHAPPKGRRVRADSVVQSVLPRTPIALVPAMLGGNSTHPQGGRRSATLTTSTPNPPL